jgi:aryl-alcohol dehydrogenase-like predicted oxidoreductase
VSLATTTPAGATPQGWQLALGTVQFGLAYGAVGQGRMVAPDEVRAILAAAWDDGVRWLDTAAAYGDIESRLAGLCGPHPFAIVSKLAPLPAADTATAQQREACVRDGVRQACERLGPRLHALLFHRVEDLAGPDGDRLWAAACETAAQHAAPADGRPLRLGVSAYGPDELIDLHQRHRLHWAQLPANALDQRLARVLADPQRAAGLQGLTLHVRSALLQGLLLAPGRGAARVPAAAAALARWGDWCAGQPPVATDRTTEDTAARLAFAAVQALPGVAACLVGVESLAQWQALQRAWRAARPQHVPALACDEPAAIDPRRWPPAG